MKFGEFEQDLPQRGWMTEIDHFGSWLRHRRRELDLTQEELARRVGCARITIRKIEAEQLRPSKQMARLLGEHLGIPSGQLEEFQSFARGGPALGHATGGPPRHNLPLQLTSFIGREGEVAAICQLLGSSRLVTLTGSGGTGKTRLSLHVAAEALDTYEDGVWFVDLAQLSDSSLVPNAVASVLGVREEQGRPLLSTLQDWLRSRHLLLVLDNCEHLLGACADFADAVLESCRRTWILATSREALGLAAETSYRVPSLACPEPDEASGLNVGQLQAYPALRLFIDRAVLVSPTFIATPANAYSIAQICFRLDGIPLAIELAAARVQVMRIEQIAQRLDDRFRLLTSGSRAALPRHQTLHSLIDWSHNLLTEPERMLLRRLSVFAGGWTLEAAEQVCSGQGIEVHEVLDLLGHLADKSLIAMDERAAEPRFRMLQTIREYARQRLAEAGEEESLHARHLNFFVALSDTTRLLLESSQRRIWLPRLEMEHDNLRAALEWSCEHDLEKARWLAGLLERFWFYGDHLGEARAWYGRVLAGAQDAAASIGLALSLLGSGCVAFNLELMDEAQASLEASVDLWQQLGDPEQTTWAREWLAYLLLQRGEAARAEAIYARHEATFRHFRDNLTLVWVLSSWGSAKAALRRDDPAAKALLDEALSAAVPLQDPFCFMMAYSCLGDWAVLNGDLEAASGYFVEALEWRRKLGTRWILAAGLWQVASILRLRGEYSEAEPLYDEALGLARGLGDRHSEAHIGQELGVVAMHRGDPQRATTLLETSLSLFRDWEEPLGVARCLLGFTDLRQLDGDTAGAARLLGFLEQWLLANHTQLLHFDRTNYQRSLTDARSHLGDAAFSAAHAEGSQMTLEQAVSLSFRGDL